MLTHNHRYRFVPRVFIIPHYWTRGPKSDAHHRLGYWYSAIVTERSPGEGLISSKPNFFILPLGGTPTADLPDRR